MTIDCIKVGMYLKGFFISLMNTEVVFYMMGWQHILFEDGQ